MKEPNANVVTKGEFRLVVLGLATLLIAAAVLLHPLARNVELVEVGKGEISITGTGGKNSPILVRGGSMTAFTRFNKWILSSSSPTKYCVNADTSYIAFDNEADPALSGIWSNTVTNPTPITPWKIDVYAQNPATTATGHTGGADQANGWTLLSQPTDCSGHQGRTSVTVSVTANWTGGTTQTGFYPFRALALPNAGDRQSSLRFLKNFPSPACQGADGGATNDQEFCERMAEVDVTVNGVLQCKCKCTDGDCAVGIGKPQ